MSTKIYYPAVFQKEDKGYSVWIPDIPGCVSQGDSFEEANNYIIEAIGLCLESYAEHNQDIPRPSSPENIKTEHNQFVSMIMFDPMEYERAYGNKSVKKTLTIPSWLNTMSEKNNINFSAVLQAALMEKLGLNS
ncbi:MAG: type II toxin-antitoxin system HicB family antitoxin [Acutalibacteraceae bacterium]